ncbi:hypothetical protein WD019_17795 [Fictibacillus sp. Mic-4]|uniref:hypothetical protein n=1 Tax=Fictibacillus sp. Mic-4 TaxID=3132826 RepID=UPI003CF47D1B
MKGWFIIQQIKVKHTSEMEKAMQKSHGIGYAEYERSLEKRLEVEEKREAEYVKGLDVTAELDRKIL